MPKQKKRNDAKSNSSSKIGELQHCLVALGFQLFSSFSSGILVSLTGSRWSLGYLLSWSFLALSDGSRLFVVNLAVMQNQVQLERRSNQICYCFIALVKNKGLLCLQFSLQGCQYHRFCLKYHFLSAFSVSFCNWVIRRKVSSESQQCSFLLKIVFACKAHWEAQELVSKWMLCVSKWQNCVVKGHEALWDP